MSLTFRQTGWEHQNNFFLTIVLLSSICNKTKIHGKIGLQECCRDHFVLSRLSVSNYCRTYFTFEGVHSASVLPQWHVKDPGHSAKSADGRLHLNTYTPMTQQSRSELTMRLSRHSAGAYRCKNERHMRLVREHLATVVSAH